MLLFRLFVGVKTHVIHKRAAEQVRSESRNLGGRGCSNAILDEGLTSAQDSLFLGASR